MAGVGVVLRGMEGGGVDMGMDGTVESCPEVVNGVRSSISGNSIRTLFLDAYWPKCTERFKCSASTGGG